MKNSRGGQEGSGGPGATAAPSPQTRLPLLFRNLGEVLGCEQRNRVGGVRNVILHALMQQNVMEMELKQIDDVKKY